MKRFVLDAKTGLRINIADREMNERLFLATFTCAVGGFAFFYIRQGFGFTYDYSTFLVLAFLFIDFLRFGILLAEKKLSTVGDPRFSKTIVFLSLCLAGLVGELASSNFRSDTPMSFVQVGTMLTLASYAALSTMTFVSKIKIASSHITLMLGLPIVVCFLNHTPEYNVLGTLLSIYLTALLLHVRLLHKQFVTLQDFAKSAQDAVVTKESNVKLNQFFQESPFPTHIMDADGTLKMVNRAWCDLWDLTEEQVSVFVGHVNLMQDSGTDQHGSIENLKKVLTGEKVRTGAVEVDPFRIGKIGRSRWVERYYNPIFDVSGKVVSVLVMYRDVTEQLKAERLLEKSDGERALALVREQTANEASKLKTEFLANMSHEIRTPINGVLGMIGFLRDTTLSVEQQEFADAAHRSAQGLLTVINDILDLSKVEAGKLELEETDFSLHEIVSDVSHVFSILSEQKNLKFNVQFHECMKQSLFGDANRIRQILNNLLSNAVKFTEHGSITLSVDLISAAGSDVEFKISVSDTGVGIPVSMQGRLFKAFEQANSSTSRRFGGTGLGLAITKNLAGLMQGAIEFASVDGEGSTFWVSLKLPKGKGLAIEPRRQEFSGDLSVFKGARILIAEDNKTNQTITRKVLQSLGVVCEIAENGHEVLALMRRSEFDLILMDCQMPGMDGFEATEVIRLFTDPVQSSIPIVGFTAGAMTADRDRCLASGMNDYLSKPANKNALVQKLGPIIEKAVLSRVA